jgi:cephalosporin hydroxylase
MNDKIKQFFAERESAIEDMAKDRKFRDQSQAWFETSIRHQYSYNFTWLGRPIIQYPQDIVAMQELIWRTRPDVIVETGVAHGGSLVLYASLLQMLGEQGRVLGIDIDIREHNRQAIESHSMGRYIDLLEGSSVSEEILRKVRDYVADKQRVFVVLDSNHTHDHVLRELELYSPLVSPGCYLVVFDTVVEDLPLGSSSNRPWAPGNNPKTAVHEFLKNNQSFEIDRAIQDKLLLTVAPDGFLRRKETQDNQR